jgi:hypothetical protein
MYIALIFDFIEWFLVFAGFCNFLLGLTLLLRPALLNNLNIRLSTWVSTRNTTKALGIPRDTDKIFLKYNTILGWILLLGFVVSAYIYFDKMKLDVFEQNLDQYQNGVMIGIILMTAKWIFLVFIVIGIILMLLLIFKPGTLNKINLFTNRWVSTRKIFLPLEKLYFQFDEFVIRHHIIFGILIIIFSGYLFYFFR